MDSQVFYSIPKILQHYEEIQHLVGYIGTFLGATFLVAGLYTATYYELVLGFRFGWITYPYAQYSAGLVISGIVLVVMGVIGLFMWRASPCQA